MTTSAVLSLNGVVKKFGGVMAVSGVSFDVEPGTVVGLVGPNGAGKTTLLNVISGFERVTEGRIEFEGADVTHLAPHHLARIGLVRTFQHAHVFDSMTVSEALLAACHVKRVAYGAAAFGGLFPNRARRTAALNSVESVIERLGLQQWANMSCGALPYGVKKRLAIGFALLVEPRLLLLDEPAAGLNSRETADLTEDLLGLNADGLTMIVIEHNMPLIMQVSEKIVALDHGAKMAEGSPEEVSRDERVVSAYLGRR